MGASGGSQSSSSTSHGPHLSERRSTGSGGSGSMLGLPTQANSNPLSPAHSPLASTRNYHQSFHQLPRPGGLHRSSEYHHQLPAIPLQAQVQSAAGHHTLLQSSTSSGHGSPQLKMRAAHYGSLPIANSTLDYEDEDFTMENVLPRQGRSIHRSRERIGQFAGHPAQLPMQPTVGNLGPAATGFGSGPSVNFGPSLTSPYPGQQPQLYGAPAMPTSPLPPHMQQPPHMQSNGWNSNGNAMTGGKLVGSVSFFDHM